jgi:Cu/Ag efflux protein CusF
VEEEVKDMKKVIFVAAVLTLVAFTFGAVAAQQKAAPAPAAQTWNAAVGVLEKIDSATKTFDFKKIVKPKGKPAIETKMTFATDDNTKIFMLDEKRKEKKLSFDYLKTGMTLWITYKVEGGKNMATSIEVR